MVTHMKTTLDLSDNLFRRAKKLAEKEGKTFRMVVEEALVTRLEAREPVLRAQSLDIPTVSGEIVPTFAYVPWDTIRDEIYPYPFPEASVPATGKAKSTRRGTPPAATHRGKRKSA